MPAKYLVTSPTGAWIPEVGLVRTGDVFTAPDGYVPSKSHRAVNEEAKAELEKLKAELQARAKEADKATKAEGMPYEEKKHATERARSLEKQANEINTELVHTAATPPKVEPGLTLRELADLPPAPGQDGGGKKSKRLADQ